MTTTGHRPTLVTEMNGLAMALAAADERPPAGHQHHRAVVMTMGALHAGHLALVRRAKELADHVVVTIFVNPLQFGPTEDLERYPRDLEGDLTLLSGDGLLGDGDVVFAPTPAVMYPEGDPVVRVTAGRIGEVLEGGFRPGHLDGVLTVVLKLMHLTRPGVALFGQKDAQQLAAVRRMVRDLDVPLTVVGVPIVRDADGLALSSRNAYLTADERRRALSLSRSLAAARSAADEGGASREVLAAAVAVLTGAEGVDSLDYAALVDPSSFEEVVPGANGPALLVLAARFGATRLIDNGELALR